MGKENLIAEYKYFYDLRLYRLIIATYNPDNVLLQPFYAGSEEDLRLKGLKAIAQYKNEDIEDIMEVHENFNFYWNGEGYYDIDGIVG